MHRRKRRFFFIYLFFFRNLLSNSLGTFWPFFPPPLNARRKKMVFSINVEQRDEKRNISRSLITKLDAVYANANSQLALEPKQCEHCKLHLGRDGRKHSSAAVMKRILRLRHLCKRGRLKCSYFPVINSSP